MPLPFLYQLLGSCPSLQELSVIDVVDGTDEQQNAQAEERPPSVKVTRTFALRRLNVFGYRAHPAVAELLSHTPTLESLGLGDISPACRDSLARVIHERKLPMLSDLTLKPLGALETLTRAIPPQQLRSITINSSGTAPMGYLLNLEILSVPIGVERWLSARLPPVLIEAMAENDTQPTYRPQWKLAEALFMDRFRQLKKLRVVDFGNVPSYCALSYAAQMEAGTKTLTLPDQGPDDEYDLESGDEDYWTSENQVNILRRAPPRNSAQV
ncbi:hypothetical protein BGZ73_002914 [Actinomortierella ambigua]|nr:hypothetical protein BGZ73_002914 [Actinomortierella ambigua]